MQETFEKLQKLQEILSEKYAIEKKLSDLPKQLNTKREVLHRIKKSRDEKAEAKARLEAKLSQIRIELTTIQDSKQSLEQKMSAIKTQREFELLEKEINDAGLEEECLRKESHKLQLDLNEAEKALELDDQLISEQEAEQQQDMQRIEAESSNEEKLLEKLSEEEKLLTPGMSSDLLYKFESIIRNKAGLGIVAVRGGICQGCHMVLPAQFVNDVRGGESINFCPHCSRIIFFEEGGDMFTNIFFDEDEMGSLSDLIDDDDYVEEEEPPLIDEDMGGDYEDN
jgi:predicted  nucleic acid-binding Zn-ribbon protein